MKEGSKIKISELRRVWNSEKENFKSKEVGTGVQSFVKKILESEDAFNLKEGKLGTLREKRKNEFIHEKSTKQTRQADFVIYVDSEIAIPVEVECYSKIENGVVQLRNYQRDLERKYGILTDGGNWRFYNNENIEKEFTIEQMFSNPLYFQDFWKEYIKPSHYYMTFFQTERAVELPVESNLYSFFEDTTFLIRSLRNKLQIEGYFADLEQKKRHQQATQIVYAYLIQFLLYKTLVDNEFGIFSKEYDTYLKYISNYIRDARYKDVFSIIERISSEISKNVYRPFKEEQNVIVDKITEIYRKPENQLSDISPWLDIFVYIKKYNFKNIQNEIFGHIYENYLKELFSEGEWGQYYTNPNVVNFMIKEVGYTPSAIKNKLENSKDEISIIDPACGSGTFLYTASDSIVNAISDGLLASQKIQKLVSKNIFGLDIEEFPLYLAEMSILMRLLPYIISEEFSNPFEKKIKVFRTKDSIAEFIFEDIYNTEVDTRIRKGQISLTSFLDLTYSSFMRKDEDIEELKKSLKAHSGMPRLRFDYVIGNPPYISYNECSKQGLLSFNLMKKGKIRLNNIYGVNLHSVPNNPKKYRPNPNLYTFFIALGLALLKNDGKICFIIPQTVLINTDLDVVRYHLAKYTTIEKIITFRGKMFIGRGIKQKRAIPTSSLIFVAKRRMPNKDHRVRIVNYLKVDDSIEQTFRNLSDGKNLLLKEIPQVDLLNSLSNWTFIKLKKEVIDFYKEYTQNSEDMEIYYNHSIAEAKFGSRFYFDGGYSIDEKKALSKPKGEYNFYYKFPRLNDKYWTIREITGYWPNIRKGSSKFRIDLRQGNQGYSLLDSKFKLIWSYNNTTKFFFTGLPLVWARNKILGIGSENRNELMFLFAILNSEVTKFLLQKYVKIEQEDRRTILVSLQIIKDLFRVPKTDETNQKIKDEIIRKVDELLLLEEKKLSDFADFSKVLLQRFDDVKIKNNKLLLVRKGDITKIKTKNPKLIAKIVSEELEKNREISLSHLKSLPVIDLDKQKKLKDYIDDLVFALYFKIPIKKIGISHSDKIKTKCKKNRFYKRLEILRAY